MAARRAPQIETPEVRDIEVAAEVQSGHPRGCRRSRCRRSDVDRVAVISRRADGEPDQTPDFEVIE